MILPAKRIDQILTDAPLAANLLARLAAARRAAELIAPLCTQIAPDFDPLIPGACDLREGVLRIWLHASAHCTKLRQSTPRLLDHLRSHGLEVNEIKVSVQPGRVRANPARDGSKKASIAGLVNAEDSDRAKNLLKLQDFSRKLALALTDSPLRQAADRLGHAAQAGLARMRESNQAFKQQNGKQDDPQT
jgi:hypothetical protein